MLSRILFIIVLIPIVLLGLYSLYGIGHFKYMYYSLDNPKADFQITGDENADVTVVEFLNYGCGYCKELHPSIKQLLTLRKDIKYIARPVVFGDENMTKTTNTVLAAGLQGKFWEMHDAILEYPEIEVPDSFIEETAALYGLDYQKLVNDAQGDAVKEIADNNMGTMEHAGLFNVPALVVNGQFYIITNDKLPDFKEILEVVTNAKNNK